MQKTFICIWMIQMQINLVVPSTSSSKSDVGSRVCQDTLKAATTTLNRCCCECNER